MGHSQKARLQMWMGQGSPPCETHDYVKDITTWAAEYSVILLPANTVHLPMIAFCFCLYWETHFLFNLNCTLVTVITDMMSVVMDSRFKSKCLNKDIKLHETLGKILSIKQDLLKIFKHLNFCSWGVDWNLKINLTALLRLNIPN